MNLDGLSVDFDLDSSSELQLQSSGGDDHVAVQLLARGQDDAIFDDALDRVGLDVGSAFSERRVKVAVGTDAEPLFPGRVARLEVWVVRDALGELADGAFGEQGLGLFWILHAPIVYEAATNDPEQALELAEQEPRHEPTPPGAHPDLVGQ